MSEEDIQKLIEAGYRVPSAGGRHPLKIVAVTDPAIKRLLCIAAIHQRSVDTAPVVLVVTADLQKTLSKYHSRGLRYVYMEAGHCGQNISLKCADLGLGCVMVGAFHEGQVKEVMKIEEEPLYLIPVGYPDPVYGKESDIAVQTPSPCK